MKKILLYLLSFLFLIPLACRKNQLGGKSSVSGFVKHHSKSIAFASVFIKFDAKEFPGSDTTIYDAKLRADENGAYTFSCYKGNYYLYSHGYDYAIPAPHIVVGGTPVNVRMNENVDLNIAVTED